MISKVDHSTFLDYKLIEKKSDKLIVNLDTLYYEDPSDYNIHLAMLLLEKESNVSPVALDQYNSLKEKYLYSAHLNIQTIVYNGTLANEYTKLYTEQLSISQDPHYSSTVSNLWNHTHFGDEITENVNEHTKKMELRGNILSRMSHITEAISKDINACINTIAWNRTEKNEFNLEIPATLVIDTFQYDNILLEQLNNKAGQIIKSYSFELKQKNDFNSTNYLVTIYLK